MLNNKNAIQKLGNLKAIFRGCVKIKVNVDY